MAFASSSRCARLPHTMPVPFCFGAARTRRRSQMRTGLSKRWRTQKSASSAAFLVASEKQAQQQLVAAGRGQQKHGVARTASSLSKAASHLSRSLMSVAWITHAHHSPTAQTLVRAEKGRAAYAWHDVVVGRAGAASAKRPEASSSLLTGTGGCTGPRSAGTYAAARTDRVGVNHQHALSTRAEHAHSDGASFPTVLLQLQHLHGVLADGKFQRDLQLNQERPGFSPMVCLLQFLHGNRAGTLMPRCRTLQHGEALRAEAEAGLTSVVPSQLPSSTTMISYVNDGLAACEKPARKPARDVVWVQKVPRRSRFVARCSAVFGARQEALSHYGAGTSPQTRPVSNGAGLAGVSELQTRQATKRRGRKQILLCLAWSEPSSSAHPTLCAEI